MLRSVWLALSARKCSFLGFTLLAALNWSHVHLLSAVSFFLSLLQPKILDAHDDRVRSMATTDSDLVVSGSASNDGYANVWKVLDWFADCNK